MAKKFDFLSPGIEIREIDQSFIPAEREAEGPIIIGRTRKGPANKPVKVRNLDDFVSVFGLPVAGGNGARPMSSNLILGPNSMVLNGNLVFSSLSLKTSVCVSKPPPNEMVSFSAPRNIFLFT